jgi:hypothetical protein
MSIPDMLEAPAGESKSVDERKSVPNCKQRPASVYNRLISIWENSPRRFLAAAHHKDHCREITRKRKKYPAMLFAHASTALWKTSICTYSRAIPFRTKKYAIGEVLAFLCVATANLHSA